MAKPVTPERISYLIGLIYDCVIKPDLWQSTIDTIRLEIGAPSCILAANSIEDGHLFLSVLSGVEPQWANRLPEYAEDSINAWGGIERMMQYPLDEPLIQTQAANPEYYHNNRFFLEWGRPQGLVD